MSLARLVLAITALSLFACSGQPTDRLGHGLHETDTHTVLWVTIDEEVRFLLAAGKAEEIIEQVENWEGTEFNVYYTLRLGGRRAPILVYGDVDAGIIAAAYRDSPLDLTQGMFFIETKGNLLPMTETEKVNWLVIIQKEV